VVAGWDPHRVGQTFGRRSPFITTIGSDGRGARRLAEGDSPAWSPGADLIVFGRYDRPHSDRPGEDTLYVVPANGGRAVALGPGERRNWSP
jgi:hypothetical protein